MKMNYSDAVDANPDKTRQLRKADHFTGLFVPDDSVVLASLFFVHGRAINVPVPPTLAALT